MSARLWLNRLRVMTRKELLQLGRDTALIIFVIYGFTLDIYLAGSGFSYDLTDAPFVAVDEDQSAYSRELIGRFHEPIFRNEATTSSPKNAIDFLDQGQALAVLDIPPDFTKSLLRGERSADVQMLVDATNTVPAQLFSSYAQQIIAEYGLEIGMANQGISEQELARLPSVTDDVRVRFNPNLQDSWFMALVELFTMISILALMLPAVAFVREKEKGTIEQLRVSPLTPLLIILPKILSMTLVILTGSFVSLLLVIHGFFGLPLNASLPLFFSLTVLFVFATAGIGIAAASIVRTQGQVAMLLILLIMPMLLLSGSWTPPEAMPWLMRKIIVVSPLYHYFKAGLGILFRDAGVMQVWPSILGLFSIGAIALGFSLWRVQRQ